MGLREPLFLGVNFVNFPDVWNRRFCSVRRVNLGQVTGGVASPSVAAMQDKKDIQDQKTRGRARGNLSIERTRELLRSLIRRSSANRLSQEFARSRDSQQMASTAKGLNRNGHGPRGVRKSKIRESRGGQPRKER